MGHFHTVIVGEGKDRKEAERNAIDDFLYEEGHRHDVRGIDRAKKLKDVPPMHTVEKREGPHTIITSERNHSAPKKDWNEVWEFELHTHA